MRISSVRIYIHGHFLALGWLLGHSTPDVGQRVDEFPYPTWIPHVTLGPSIDLETLLLERYLGLKRRYHEVSGYNSSTTSTSGQDYWENYTCLQQTGNGVDFQQYLRQLFIYNRLHVTERD